MMIDRGSPHDPVDGPIWVATLIFLFVLAVLYWF